MSISVRQLLRSHGLIPKKGFSQNFLTDTKIAEQIVGLSGVGCDDRVVEIGPGIGSLTGLLLQKVGTLWAIEQDAFLLPILQGQTAGMGRLHLLNADALRINYLDLAEQLGGPLHIVANLPYQISTPILLLLLEQRQAIHSMTLMFQKEVADRLCAPPNCKEYGALTVQCRLWAETSILLDVPPESFYPVPKVNSAVVGLTMRTEPLVPVENPHLFTRIVRAAFGQRRKMLRNALKILDDNSDAWLVRADIDPMRRGETLDIIEFARLSKEAQPEMWENFTQYPP
ncbi:MAG: 16S rRNA (adenine(1518)-N(6)/adenine(1519)-N(6))-dimethyltransferase RsmA [Magnetococcus sp. DMHC-6]